MQQFLLCILFYCHGTPETVFESVEKRSISVFSGYDGDTGIYESTLKTDKDENNDSTVSTLYPILLSRYS